jgi:hypothetical protein
MKRYFSGILAITLAVAVSSFTTTVKTKTTLQTFGFWYQANGSLVGTAIYQDGNNPIDKQSSTIQSATSCPDAAGDVCVMGYSSQLTPGNPIPSDLTRDGEVLKN